ncbi:DUF192 domain-containing protein [Leptolyngbya sp. AN03gr2]|uniref:DUF192 domain-containing protein n=1 Tax=unclassified Leptolyngbya TaxID=2650499 RepID=UPI003D321F3A
MKYQILCLSLGVLLLGCSAGASQRLSTEVKPSESPAIESPSAMGQVLPLTASFKVGDQLIKLEVARTSEEQAMGLMYRTSLADDRGMLFPFDPPRPTQFWMKNTLIPLDMLFLRRGEIRVIKANVPPCKADPCPTYGSPTEDIDQVIELRAGRAAELGLKVGDRIAIQQIRN